MSVSSARGLSGLKPASSSFKVEPGKKVRTFESMTVNKIPFKKIYAYINAFQSLDLCIIDTKIQIPSVFYHKSTRSQTAAKAAIYPTPRVIHHLTNRHLSAEVLAPALEPEPAFVQVEAVDLQVEYPLLQTFSVAAETTPVTVQSTL